MPAAWHAGVWLQFVSACDPGVDGRRRDPIPRHTFGNCKNDSYASSFRCVCPDAGCLRQEGRNRSTRHRSDATGRIDLARHSARRGQRQDAAGNRCQWKDTAGGRTEKIRQRATGTKAGCKAGFLVSRTTAWSRGQTICRQSRPVACSAIAIHAGSQPITPDSASRASSGRLFS